MLPRHHDAIVAVATAPGRGAVGIVRVSGRALEPLIEALCGRPLQPRQATYLPFLAGDGSTLDQGLALHFPAPHSYTGESVLELQAHGGPVLLQLLLARCLEAAAQSDAKGHIRLPGLRLAGPGEFTERAFLNGKLDLAQAEAVSDLIEASTESAARSAGRSLSGEFSKQVNLLRERLVELRMLVEATLDFPEEEIDFLEKADARGRLDRVCAALDAVLDRARSGALLREGIKVVLAGQPNVGKSSLLNALAGAELAIVTPIPGTTRDKVSETIQIHGVPVHVIDTAGLRDPDESADEVERIGIARSWAEIAGAGAVVFLRDLTRQGEAGYDAGDARIAQRWPQGLAASGASGRGVQQGRCRERRAAGRCAGHLGAQWSGAGSSARAAAATGRLARATRGRVHRAHAPRAGAAPHARAPRTCAGAGGTTRRRAGPAGGRAAPGARRARRDHRRLHGR
jgi:tRNA modification GTPase